MASGCSSGRGRVPSADADGTRRTVCSGSLFAEAENLHCGSGGQGDGLLVAAMGALGEDDRGPRAFH